MLEAVDTALQHQALNSLLRVVDSSLCLIPIIQTDAQFFLGGDQNPAKRAQFNVDTISTQSGTRRFDLPNVGTNTSTTLLANDTFQTITNKTIIIKDGELQITGSPHQLIRLLS